ncbi:MAG: hypothetical protein WKF88_05600 [Ferruginibacter sp.]
MSTLQIDKKTAQGLYPAASGKFKSMLEDQFGADQLKVSIMDRIKTWEDAACEFGIDPVEGLPFPHPKTNRQKAANAFFQLDIINELLLEGAELDWSDSDQRKWYPYFNDYKSGAGFRFDGAGYVWATADAGGGARLCLDTQEKAKYFGTQFLDIWNQFLNPIK